MKSKSGLRETLSEKAVKESVSEIYMLSMKIKSIGDARILQLLNEEYIYFDDLLYELEESEEL